MNTQITVFGSFDPERANADVNQRFRLEQSYQDFVDACMELGRRLAKRHVILNACSDTPETADLHVTLGFLEEAQSIRDPASFIQVFRPLKKRRQEGEPFGELLLKPEYDGLLRLADRRRDNWNVTHLRALRRTDAVITLGGLNNTYSAGTAAVIAGKRLVPIASFGGSSARLLDELGTELGTDTQSELALLSSPCSRRNNYSVLDIAISLALWRETPRVFIIHGHGRDWEQVAELIEREANLKIIDMQTEGRTGETMPQRFEHHASSVSAAIAVVTPDDVGRALKDQAWTSRPRGRQNVWLEVGWFWGRLGRDRVMLLIKREPQWPDIERPSDLQGLEFAEYEGTPDSVREKILKFLREVQGE